jgi:hypothetical protein
MPIRWYGPADPADPTYRHFERIVNLTLHAMVFAALNSGLWVLQGLRHPWPHLKVLTIAWAGVLLIHASVVFRLRPVAAESAEDSPEPGPPSPPAQDPQS